MTASIAPFVPLAMALVTVPSLPSPGEDPRAACHMVDHYLVAWQTMNAGGWYGVWGRIAYANETMEAQFGIVQPGPSHSRTEAAVGGGFGHFLTAWEHEAGLLAYRDIHGRVVFPDLLFRDGFE